MRDLKVKVNATISNKWITTEYIWKFRNHFIAQQQIDNYKRIYGKRLNIINIKDI